MKPIFFNLNNGLHGSIVPTPNGGLVVSVFHEPTGRTLYGFDRCMFAAQSWMDGAKLTFVNAEGKA